MILPGPTGPSGLSGPSGPPGHSSPFGPASVPASAVASEMLARHVFPQCALSVTCRIYALDYAF